MIGTGIKVRFSPYSDEVMCGKPVDLPTAHGAIILVACMRTDGHEPPCIAAAGEAGKADGVRFCCRVAAEARHAAWCVLIDKELRDAIATGVDIGVQDIDDPDKG